MNAVQETTFCEGEKQFNHIYLMDGSNAVAYIKNGTTEPYYFTKPLRIIPAGRTFKPVVPSPFKMVKDTDTIEVTGSKGQTYFVNTVERRCTCPGYIYRGDCKHIKDLK